MVGCFRSPVFEGYEAPMMWCDGEGELSSPWWEEESERLHQEAGS